MLNLFPLHPVSAQSGSVRYPQAPLPRWSLSCLVHLLPFALLLLQLQPVLCLTVSELLSSHMVLQRAPHSPRLWGSTDAHAKVNAQLAGSAAVTTTADAAGRWELQLPPHEASTGEELTISDGSTTLTFVDVSFGEVLLCSGQSNMVVPVVFSFGGMDAINDAHLYTHTRLFDIPGYASLTPLDRFYRTTWPGWVLPSDKTLWSGNPNATSGIFSAACWYSGRALSAGLNDSVPIGLIQSSVSGTVVEAWTSLERNRDCGVIPPLIPHENNTSNQPGACYNAMIHPLLSYTIGAVIWWQGENNRYFPPRYGCAFSVMIDDWRERFREPQLPFYFVLLAADNDTAWARNATALLRLQQLEALQLPHTAVANAVDVGDPTSPIQAVHSRNKSYVGDRVALLMLHNQYNQEHIVALGPFTTPRDVRLTLSPDGSKLHLTVSYAVSRYNEGLFIANTPHCWSCCDGLSSGLLWVQAVNHSAVAFPAVDLDPVNRRQLRANVSVAQLLGGKTAQPAALAQPLQVTLRLQYDMYPQCALYNAALLPSLPWSVDVEVEGGGRRRRERQTA